MPPAPSKRPARGNREHPVARAVRALRTYAGISRDELGARIGVAGTTVGDWERGYWKVNPPSLANRQAVARACGVDELLTVLGAFEEDPSMQVADAAREEAERQGGHSESGPEGPPDEDEADEGR